MIVPRDYYTGTDSVNGYTLTGPIPAHQVTCARGLNLPAGTAGIEIGLGSGGPQHPAVQMELRAAGRIYRSAVGPGIGGVGIIRRVVFPIPRRPMRPESVPASICVTAAAPIAWAVSTTTEGIQPPMTVNGQPTFDRLAVWYRPPPGAKRSYMSEIGSILSRATAFAPGFLRPWLLGAVLFGLLPALAVLSVRCLALAADGHARRLGLWLYVIAALNAMAWAVITPAFQAPDEVDHFAYVQALVEQGKEPATYYAPGRARWSTAEDDALQGTAVITDHITNDTRAPSLAADVQSYRRLLSATGADRADGGGYETATSHGPVYYLAVAPGYILGGSSIFAELTFARICSALIGALACLFTYLLVRELSPSRVWLAVLAALLVAFQPMYSFLSGVVNNDIAIDAGAAAVAYLLVRLLRRSIDWRTTLPLGLILGILPFAKATAYDLYPLAAVALVGAIWVHRRPLIQAWRGVVGGIVVLALATGAGHLVGQRLSEALQPPAAPATGAAAGISATTANGVVTQVLHQPISYLSYLWQALLPPLPFMTPHFPAGTDPFDTIFVHRGWAAFGWYDVLFPNWVYHALVVVMAVVALIGILAVYRERRVLRRRWIEVSLVVLFPIVVFAAFEAAFYTATNRPLVAEQGRYLFPALAPLAALVVGTLFGLGRRRMLEAGTVLLVAMLALCYASQLLTLTSFYA